MIPANKKVSFTDVPQSLTNQIEQTLSKTKSESLESEKKQSTPDREVKAAEKPAVTQVNSTAETKINEKPKENAESSVIIEENRSKAAVEKKKNDRNGQINICIPPEIKTEWKLLFTKNNVNITQGIIFAVEHLRNEIENGNAILTVGGVIRKN